MFTKLKNKINNMSINDWIVVSLWLLTFLLLIVFVIIAAVVEKSKVDLYATLLASFGLIFGILLFGSLIVTVTFAYQKKKGGK